jgi:phosphoglycerate dehydrogenase-like enzyme
LTRGIAEAVRYNSQREWRGGATVELTDKTLGIIGMGEFGVEMAKRAAGYDMRVIAIDPVRRDRPQSVDELKESSRETLYDLLSRADVVMMACPRTEATYHLIGREELLQMKNSAYLINVTRGGIIDEGALVDALKMGGISGAGLDVVEEEPLSASSPLWDAPNLILTPHRAGASQHRPRKIFEFFCAQLERYLRGETPLNIVDKRRGF